MGSTVSRTELQTDRHIAFENFGLFCKNIVLDSQITVTRHAHMQQTHACTCTKHTPLGNFQMSEKQSLVRQRSMVSLLIWCSDKYHKKFLKVKRKSKPNSPDNEFVLMIKRRYRSTLELRSPAHCALHASG